MRFCIWRARALLRAEKFSAMADFFSAAAEMFSAQADFSSANGGKVFRHTSKYRVFSAEFVSAGGGKEIRPSGKNIRRGEKKSAMAEKFSARQMPAVVSDFASARTSPFPF